MINLKDKKYLILGTSTNIGKSFFVCNFCQKMKNVKAIKPLISGFEIDDYENDSYKILDSLDLEKTLENIEKISPFRLKEPFSPLKASEIEGKKIDFDEIVKFCTNNILEIKDRDEILLIEGAGGVMTPINHEKTFLDLAEKLKIKIILISGVFLGSISQTLCAIEALKSRGAEVEMVIVNDFVRNIGENLDSSDIIKEIEVFSGVKSVSMDEFFGGF